MLARVIRVQREVETVPDSQAADKVVVNAEEQYSIRPDGRDLLDAGWMDTRPLSLRSGG